MPEGLLVQGCGHEVVGGIVNGSFTRLPDLSHGKPVYKRDGQVKGLDVHVYFWDERDGPRFNGWYFGMKVGGDEVWAFHPGKDSPLPPASGWQVPYDGPVDAGFLVAPSGAGAPPKRAAEEPLDAYGQPAPKQARQDWEASAAAQALQPQMQQLQQPLAQQPPQPFHLQPQAQQQQMMQHWEIAQQWQQYQLMQQQQQQHMMQWQAAQQQQQQQLQQQQQRQRQQQLLEQKKRAEDERRRKLEEAKRKRDDENRKRLDDLIKRADEEKAVKLVMPIIQKLRVATPESFPVLKQELEDVLEKEKTRAGGQFQRLRMEADKALDAAAKCIEMIVARRRLVEEKLAAEEKRRRDLDEAAKALVEELRNLVEKAEAQSQRLAEAATPLGTDGPTEGTAARAEATSEVASGEEATSLPAPLSSEELLAACERVEAEGAEAESMTRACTAFVLQKGPEMKRLVPMTLGGADPSDISHTLAKLLQHVRDLAAMSEKTLARARATKERAGRRLTAEARARQADALFAKYDRDSDGLLSRKEALSYAKAEFNFQIPVETLDKMWKTLVAEGSKGVPLSDFHRLKVAVGTAREVTRDRARAVEREEREQVLEEVKDVLKEKIKDVAASVSDADKFVAKVEKQVQPLLATAKGMSVSDMLALSDETDAMIEEARAITAKVCQQMDAVSEGTSERFQQDVRAYAAQEAKPLDLRVRRMEARLGRATNLSRRFRELASKRREAEFQRLRIAALRVLRHNQRLRSVQDAEVFAESVSERDFVAFFEAANKDVDLKAEAAAQATGEEAGEGAMAVEQALEQPVETAPGQGMDVQTDEADKGLAGELVAGAGGAPAETGQAPAVAAEACAGANADVPMEAPAGAGEPSAEAAAGEGAPTEAPGDASAEAEVPLEQSGVAADAAPTEPPDSDKKAAVETMELSEEDTACLFNFLTEGAGSISRQDLFTRLASSIIQPSLTEKERSTATVQHGISGRCVSPRRPSETGHRALSVR